MYVCVTVFAACSICARTYFQVILNSTNLLYGGGRESGCTMAESSYPSNQEGKGRAASFNEKLGEFKKFASTSFTRARQVSEPSGWKWD